jgi:hypothetical protein
MINVNYYVTMDDAGIEKYVVTVDGPESELQTISAEDLGLLIKAAIASPAIPLGGG